MKERENFFYCNGWMHVNELKEKRKKKEEEKKKFLSPCQFMSYIYIRKRFKLSFPNNNNNKITL